MHSHVPDAFHDPVAARSAAVSGEGARWTALLDGIDVDRLTEDFLERVRQLGWYREEVLTSRELRASAGDSFRAILRSMDPRVDAAGAMSELVAIAAHVGTSRARLGAPVEMLLHAIRIDFTVLWGQVVSIASDRDAVMLVGRAELMWRTVETYAAETHHAYIAERARMDRESDAVRRARISRLFVQGGVDERELRETAAALGLPVDGELQIAVVATGHVVEFRAALVQAELREGAVFTAVLGEATLAFWARDDRPGSALRDLADRVLGLPCAFDDAVQGLAGVPSAARTCVELLDVVGDAEAQGGAVTMRDGWARLARRRLSVSGQRLGADLDRALASVAESERERLVEAVDAYLRTGSVQEAAERTYCHRNTLMNRLRRFRELTDVDVTVPIEAARVVVAWS